MSQTHFRGTPVQTSGDLPAIGTSAPSFTLTKADLGAASLGDFAGKKLVLNVFPSIDTGVCAASVRRFNAEASQLPNTTVLCISRDLPFALNRFCAAEGLTNVVTLSDYRTQAFGAAYGLELTGSPLAGLLARSVFVVDEKGTVTYAQLVPEITQEPDYAAALAAL
jgi:thiol peroxidase